MNWTPENLTRFKSHFNLRDIDIAKGVGVMPTTIANFRKGLSPMDRISPLLTAYAESVRAGRIREHEAMIEFYKTF